MKLKKPKRPTPSSSRPGAGRLTRPDTARAQAIALEAAKAGLDKKAGGVEIIDVTGKVDYADYLVVMTGQSDRHVAAIADSVEAELAKSGTRAISTEGLPAAEWVLIDFVDVVVHVFVEELRSLYDLDGLWMDARRIPVPDDAPGGG